MLPTATVMNDTSKGWLQAVVNDMCSYTTSTGTKDVEETDADGNVTTVTKSVLYVNVTLKSYRDMISVYGFDANQVEMLEQIMSADFMGQLGYAGSGSGGGGGSPGVSSMTEDEINAILSGITDSRQKKVCSYALHRVGFPYSQDMRDSGNYYDCSSLAYYSSVANGEIGIFALNGEAYIKKLQNDKDGIFLISLNEKYAPIKVGENDRLDIFGKVLGKSDASATNSNEKVQVGDAEMSIDTILIKMAQLNKRKSVLDQMRKQLPKAREEQRSYMSRNTVPEYRYINYDLELIKKEYEAVSKTIMEMQMALDKYNQTVQFEVDI